MSNERLVSIIIPLHNRLEFTRSCIDSIAKNTRDVEYEIVAVNNASTDGTLEYLESLGERVKTINATENLGYVGGCNAGAAGAGGRYLLFLNNDTEVQPGWLTNLLSVMERTDCGAVGAKLVYPDGRLQEAGGIIFYDGNGWNFGNGDDPHKGIYNQVVEVDYCSGAALLVRTDLFQKLGGFDTRYAPAYYEDSDLCFGIRKLGYHILFDPHAVVIHHESVTSGKDPSSGFKKYILINRPKFIEKWQEELRLHSDHPRVSGIMPVSAERKVIHPRMASVSVPQGRRPKKVLLFFPQNPYPPVTGAHHGNLVKLRALHKLGCETTLFSTTLFGPYPWSRESIDTLKKDLNVNTIVYEGNSLDREYMAREEGRSIHGVNWQKYLPPGLVRKFREVRHTLHPDVTIINYAYWGGLIAGDDFRCDGTIMDTQDMVSLNTKLRAAVEPYLRMAPYSPLSVPEEFIAEDFFSKLALEPERTEFQIFDLFHHTLAVSPAEAASMVKHVERTRVSYAPTTFAPFDVDNTYAGVPVFVSGDNPFNVQAYLYFAARVIPKILKTMPGFQVHVAGDASRQVVAVDGVKLLGRVPELKPLYAQAPFAVCPIIGATGMSIKTVEAMAHGVPVVALRNAAGGTPIHHGVNGFIAANAEEFAEYVARLTRDRLLCARLGRAARETIAQEFSEKMLIDSLSAVLDEAGTRTLSREQAREFQEISKSVAISRSGLATSTGSAAGSPDRKRIAIGLTEHFGDIVACEPVARYLKQQHPRSHITWVIRATYRELVDTNPYVDETCVVQCLSDWIELKSSPGFDEVIDLHVNNRVCTTTGQVLRKTVGNLDVNVESYYSYGSLLNAFSQGAGLPALTEAPRVYIPQSAVHTVNALFLPENYVVVHCTSSERSRDWEEAKWKELIGHILGRWNVAVIEVGAAPALSSLTNTCGGRYINLCGRLSFLETAEVIRRSKLFIGVDSGPAQLANAVGTVGVILLGRYRIWKTHMPFTGGYADGTKASIIQHETGSSTEIPVESVRTEVEKYLGQQRFPATGTPATSKRVDEGRGKLARLIAFYLPQFHPIPENDLWWGRGFTEWTNVTRSQSVFPGHYQPHVPADLGYYDLRLEETRIAQAELAKQHGIEGFCYWHYWFNGKRLIEQPFNDVLASGKPDFPFCLAWANENWTRRWDGFEKEILQEQTYGGVSDDTSHFAWLLGAFKDSRYIRIDNKPVFLIYNPSHLPDAKRTIALWRGLALEAGLPGIFLIAIKSHVQSRKIDWMSQGFDGELFFQPNWTKVEMAVKGKRNDHIAPVDWFDQRDHTAVVEYDDVWPLLAADEPKSNKSFACVVPSWDNSPRRQSGRTIIHRANPHSYERWLQLEIDRVKSRPEDFRLVFVNAWNEWAEGNHLEPDQRFGRAFLEATRNAATVPLSETRKYEVLTDIGTAALRIGDNNTFRAFFQLGQQRVRQNRARAVLEAKLMTSRAEAHNKAGVVHARKGSFDLAEKEFNKAVSEDPAYAPPLQNLIRLYIQQGRHDEALNTYRRLFTCFPDDVDILTGLGDTLLHVERYDEAEEFYRKALKDAPADQCIRKRMDTLGRARRGQWTLAEVRPLVRIAGREQQGRRDLVPDSVSHPRATALTSIIVVTYNNLKYTRKCIESVRKHTKSPYEIILVDNGSVDGTGRWAEGSARRKEIHTIILNKENAGFPAGINQALNVAQGRYVLLLNNDTIVTKGWLEKLIAGAEYDPAIAIVGPMSNLVSGVQLDATVRYSDIAGMHEHASEVARLNLKTILPVPRVAFLCTLIKRELIEKVGGLDERFTPGNFEDDDYCLRAQLAGYKTVIAKDVFIHHYGSMSFGADGRDAYAKRIETNRRIFIEKWGADPMEIWRDNKEFKRRNLLYPLSKDGFVQHFERARILIEEKELALALVSLKKAIACFASSERKGYAVELADALDLTGNVALAINDPETAQSCFMQELGCSSDASRAQAGLEKVHSMKSGLSSSPNCGKNFESTEAQGTLHRVEQLCHRGHMADAVALLEQSVKMSPGNRSLRSSLAWLFIKNKMFDDASNLIRTTPETMKKSVEWLEIAGYCVEGQGMDEVAVQCADKALEISPSSVKALTLKAILAAKSGGDADAERFFDLALRSNDEDPQPHLHLGALLWARGDHGEGFKHLERAFILDPGDGEIGMTYYKAADSLSRLEDAEAHFRKASAKYPVHRQLKHFLADVLVRRGKPEEAMDTVEEAITVFGGEGDILPFALDIRKVVGPRRIHQPNGSRETVSLCMIVKDEEESLAKCLSSIKSLVDEIIIVDTGSTDKTKAIAEVFGARVFDFPWTEDFSKARNFSLSKAAGDWILVLDGDEVLSPVDHEKLMYLVASGKKRAFSFTTKNYVAPTDTQDWIRNDGKYSEEAGTGWIASVKVRLFPRLGSIQFRGAVHELVETSLAESGIEVRSCDIPIHHYGKLDVEKSRSKGESYVRLGKMKLAEAGPGDTKALSELAIQENELGNYEEALEIGLRVVQLAPDNPRAHMGVGSNYIGLHRFEEAVESLKKSINLDPKLNEAYIRCTIALLMLGRAPEAVPLLKRLAKRDPSYPYSKSMLAAALFCSGQKIEALKLMHELRAGNMTFDPFFADLAQQLRANGRVADAVALLEPLYEAEIISRETALLLVECYKSQAMEEQENGSKVFP